MKQLGILLFIIICFMGVRCEAKTQYSDTLTKMEKTLFGTDYNAQNDDLRIKRIEEEVYGKASSKPLQQRISKLSTDLSADLIGQEIDPKRDTFATEEDSYKEPIPKADSSVNYPVVDSMEKTVFNKAFKTTEINQRLANLEQKVFKKTYKDDLNSRVERLKNEIMPQRLAQKSTDEDDSDYYSQDNFAASQQFQDDAFGNSNNGMKEDKFAPEYLQDSGGNDYSANSDIAIPLGDLEKKVLKKSFPNDVVSNRLLRLELKVFNSSFTDDDEQTRFDRIASAYQAKKSAKRYDNNKFSQHAATAMQVGAILLMILAAIL